MAKQESSFHQEWWERYCYRLDRADLRSHYDDDLLFFLSPNVLFQKGRLELKICLLCGRLNQFPSVLTPSHREYYSLCEEWGKIAFAALFDEEMKRLRREASRQYNYTFRSESVYVKEGPMLKRRCTQPIRAISEKKFNAVNRDADCVKECVRLQAWGFFQDPDRCRRMRQARAWVALHGMGGTDVAIPWEGAMLRQYRKCMLALTLRRAYQQHCDALIAGHVYGWLIRNAPLRQLDAKPTKGLEHYAAAASVACE